MIMKACLRVYPVRYAMLLFIVLLIFFSGFQDSVIAATKMLMLNPTRVIFTERDRTVQASISNPTNVPLSYSISLVTMRKDDKGNLYKPEKESAEEIKIKKMIRFSPRRAKIMPGKRQLVKLMVRKPADLLPGEYQTRLQLTPSPEETQTNKTVPSLSAAQGGMDIDLDIVVNSTFPIIIQHGGIGSLVEPQHLSLVKQHKAPSGIAAQLKLRREGDASAFGNVFVYYMPSGVSKKMREVGRVKGVAIYLPQVEKNVTIPLTNINSKEITDGVFRVIYRSGTNQAGKGRKKAKGWMKDFRLDFS